MSCSRCGKCCMVIPVRMPKPDPALAEYFYAHGIKWERGIALIPSVCQHLRICGDNPEVTYCMIYEARPALCRVQGLPKTLSYRPEGCTNENE
jgi:Fe-S-cluster containining protein